MCNVNTEVEMEQCEVCGAKVPANEAVETVDHFYVCQDCIQREYVECNNCGDYIPRDEAMEGADGNLYCEDCFDVDFVICERCGKAEYSDDTVAVYNDSDVCRADAEVWCADCADSNAIRCDICGNYFRYAQDVETDDSGHCICQHCFDDNCYHRCDCCGEILSEDEQFYDSDGCFCYCESCSPDDNVINVYHRGPRPFNWHGGYFSDRRDVLFMGWELEIDSATRRDDRAADAERIVGAAGYGINESIVCELDGSLDYGFELISSTATLDYHLNRYGVDDLMEEAVELGYTSHDAGTCGLHVHVDREYFADAMENAENIACIILVNNADWLKKFSRRTDFGYCNFPENVEPFRPEEFKPSVPGVSDEIPARDVMAELGRMRRKCRTHNDALNFAGNTAHTTIEFRFNRGTLNFETYCATMQLVQMYADAMKHSRLSAACKINLKWFKRVAKRRGYTEFLAYLERRNIQ